MIIMGGLSSIRVNNDNYGRPSSIRVNTGRPSSIRVNNDNHGRPSSIRVNNDNYGRPSSMRVNNDNQVNRKCTLFSNWQLLLCSDVCSEGVNPDVCSQGVNPDVCSEVIVNSCII